MDKDVYATTADGDGTLGAAAASDTVSILINLHSIAIYERSVWSSGAAAVTVRPTTAQSAPGYLHSYILLLPLVPVNSFTIDLHLIVLH